MIDGTAATTRASTLETFPAPLSACERPRSADAVLAASRSFCSRLAFSYATEACEASTSSTRWSSSSN